MANLPTLVCPVCGAENPSTRQFCRRCASDLHAIVAASAQPITPPVPAVATAGYTATSSTAPSSTATSSTPESTASSPLRPILIGGGIALVILAILGGLLLVLGGGPAASPSPAPTASTAPTTAVLATATPAPTVPPVTAAPTPTTTPAKTPSPTPTKAPSTSPKVDSFSAPHSASCTGLNGTSTPGFIHLSWSASNTTGVRLSIDPPSPSNAYNYGYLDYPAMGSDDVPFSCDAPLSDANGSYHLYVVTTIHTTGHYAYRYLKVYLKP